MTTKPLKNRGMLSRLLLRDERVLAAGGLLAALTIVGGLGASAWWIYQTQQADIAKARSERLDAAVQVLATGVQSILNAGQGEALAQVGAARRMVMEAAARHNLEVCRVELPDGTTLVDAAAKKGLRALPEVWPSAATTATPAPDGGLVQEIHMAGRGSARLLISAAPAEAPMLAWEVQLVIGAVGVVVLGAMLWTYRLLRGIRGVLAIREALAGAGAAQAEGRTLRLDEAMGQEAAAWNTILAQRDEQAHRALLTRVEDQMTRRAGADGDLATACDALSMGLVLVDESCRIKYLNGAAAVFLGAKREEALGKTLGELNVEEEVIKIASSAAKGQVRARGVVETRRTSADEQRLRAPSQQDEDRRGQKRFGGGVLRFTVRPVRREDTGAATIAIEDVTQQKAAEEARNSFVAQATHELRTPLTSIKLYVEQLIEEQEAGGSDPAARGKALNVINQEARRLERIVGDMLSVAEIEAGSLKLHTGDVRLGPLFDELRSEFEPQATNKQMGLLFDLPPKWPVIMGDRDKIALLIHNVVGNAIKYTPAGGRVTVRVAVLGTGKAGQLVVEVIDTGIGIRDDESELIFEKFYRAKDKRVSEITGSGLGLALAREVARMHGGDIKVQSQFDKGSTFTVNLPLAA